jgi:hypothetical protein
MIHAENIQIRRFRTSGQHGSVKWAVTISAMVSDRPFFALVLDLSGLIRIDRYKKHDSCRKYPNKAF